LAFFSFLAGFLGAMVFSYAPNALEGVCDLICKMGANVHRKKPAAHVLSNVGSAAEEFRLVGFRQRKSVG
jgi:hypothetical protein